MIGLFRWNAHNIEHIAEHGVTTKDAEFVVSGARPPFPRMQLLKDSDAFARKNHLNRSQLIAAGLRQLMAG